MTEVPNSTGISKHLLLGHKNFRTVKARMKELLLVTFPA